MTQEKNRFVKNKDKKAQFSSNNELLGSDSKIKKYTLSLKPANVAILNPSFLCPALQKPDDDLHLIILTDEAFFNTFEKSEGKEENKAGPALSGAVNRFLKIVSWGAIDKSKHSTSPLFKTNDEAIENVEVHFLWKLSEVDKNKLLNKDEEIFSQIHPAVKSMYLEEGLKYGFEIVIHNSTKGEVGLYNIAWMNYQTSKNNDEEGYFYELQDDCLNNYNQDFRSDYGFLSCDVGNDYAPDFTEEETIIQSYHPLFISNKDCLDTGQLSDVHVSSRQHIFTESKARLIDGDLDDSIRSGTIGEMVNTSYSTLKNLMKQMGSKVDLLIFTGDLIDYNRNFNPDNKKNGLETINNSNDIWNALNLDHLTDKEKYPIGIDNLVMYELFRWYYSTYNKPIMLVSGNHEAYTVPYGISPRVKIARSANSSYNPWGNIFSTIEVDDVIKKSIQQAKNDAEETMNKGPNIYDQRANEGIPADHNLTIPEAILMYGTDYARVVMSGSFDIGGERNFRAENLNWFYKIFTPLSSFITTYNNQSFIALGWGDDEQFMDAIPFEQGGWSPGGYLPRSPEGITDEQLELLEQGLKIGKSINTLCSHFTYINYDTKQPISKEGNINYNDFWRNYSKYDYGTFQTNRKTVYKKIIDNKIQYTLSGHSHRSGLYQVNDGDLDNVRSNMSVKGTSVNNKNVFDIDKNDKCRVLVAGCGGPVGVQNHENELYNWGLDYPSGNYIQFNGSKEKEIGTVIPSSKQARPRLAVALDYADIFLQEDTNKGLLSKFESTKNNKPLSINVNSLAKLPKTEFIDKITMYFYLKDETIKIVSGKFIERKNSNEMEFHPSDKLFDMDFKESSEQYIMGYIKIKLKKPSINSFIHYDISKDWEFPIQIFSQKKLAFDELNKTINILQSQDVSEHSINKYRENENNNIKINIHGYSVQRHKKFGEVPDFRFYKDLKNKEYA